MMKKELQKIQEKVASGVILKDDFELENIKLVAGFEVIAKQNNIICYGVIVDKDSKVVDKKYTISKEKFPYVPTLLMFREGQPIIDTFAKFNVRPDLIMVNGNGILHPMKSGLASYVGVSLNVPTIGIAKKLLCGEVHQGKVYLNGEARGGVLYTKEGSNPIFVSPGHRVSVDMAGEVVKTFLRTNFKLPEPLRLAHKFANKIKKQSVLEV